MSPDEALRLDCIREAIAVFPQLKTEIALLTVAKEMYKFVTEQRRAQEKKEAERVSE